MNESDKINMNRNDIWLIIYVLSIIFSILMCVFFYRNRLLATISFVCFVIVGTIYTYIVFSEMTDKVN